jgi:hypothetical protein
MSDDKKQQDNTAGSSSSGGSGEGNNSNNNTGDDIPYVPPSDRTNLNEVIDFDSKPLISQSIITKDE